MTRARDIANFGDGIATADIDDGAVTAAKKQSLRDATDDPAIANASTPEELKDVRPSSLDE